MNQFKPKFILFAISFLALSSLFSCKKISPDEPFPEEYHPTVYTASNNKIVYAIDLESGERKWKISVDGEVHASPIIAFNFLWVATTANTLYKIDYRNGSIIEELGLGAPILATPYEFEGMLLVAAGSSLFALNPVELVPNWVYLMGGQIASSPTSYSVEGIDDHNVIFLSSTSNKVVALNPEGFVLWEYSPSEPGAFYSSPNVVNDSFLYIGNDNGNMYSIYTFDGTEKWAYKTDGQIRSSPIHIDGNVLFGSYDRNFYSVDSATGLLRWKIPTNDVISSSPAFHNQFVYFGSHDRYIYCVDVIDGEIEWKKPTSGLIKSSPTIYNGDIYLGSFDKNLYRMDARDGSQKWIFNVNGQMESSPLIDGISGVGVSSIDGSYNY